MNFPTSITKLNDDGRKWMKIYLSSVKWFVALVLRNKTIFSNSMVFIHYESDRNTLNALNLCLSMPKKLVEMVKF